MMSEILDDRVVVDQRVVDVEEKRDVGSWPTTH
jgi:hypothetical protein